MQEKLPFGKFLIPFGYQGPYVAVRLEDKDNPVFGGKAWWIYSRWLDIASDFKDPQDDYGKKILERITCSMVRHHDHIPYCYVEIPSQHRLTEGEKDVLKLAGIQIPHPAMPIESRVPGPDFNIEQILNELSD